MSWTWIKVLWSFFTQCYNQALGPPHFLAYLIDQRNCGSDLMEEEKKKASDFAKKIIPVIS